MRGVVVRCNLNSDSLLTEETLSSVASRWCVASSIIYALIEWTSPGVVEGRAVISPEGGRAAPAVTLTGPWLADSVKAAAAPLHRRGRAVRHRCIATTMEAFIECSAVNTLDTSHRHSAAVCEVDRANWSRKWRLRRVHSNRRYYFLMIENAQRIVFWLYTIGWTV